MSLSVGVLYSAQELLALISASEIEIDAFQASFEKFAVASAKDVLAFSQQCNWIAITEKGQLVVTPKGEQILQAVTKVVGLRYQVRDAIEVLQPAWAQRIRHGRREVKHGIPSEIFQCFNEAGLWDAWDDDLIGWWDGLALASRAKHSERLLEIGRRAERLSVVFEHKRTKTIPQWQSLETNFSGFDVLSQIDESDITALRIEVKGSHHRLRDAYFNLTRSEWGVAETTGNYRFHLWLLRDDPPTLIEVDHVKIRPHVPQNRGDGSWEICQIPFSPFR